MKSHKVLLPVLAGLVLAASPLAVFAEDVSVSAEAEAQIDVRGPKDDGLQRRIDLIERAKKERMDLQERFRTGFASTTERPASTSLRERMEERKEVRVEKMQERGGIRIEDRIARLKAQIERVSKMERLSAEQKADITADLEAQITALTELKAKMDAETDPEALKELKQSITKEYRVYAVTMPKAAITAAADRIMKVVAQMEAFGEKLSTRVEAAGSAEASSSLDVYTDAVAAAKVSAQAAASLVADLEADNSDTAVASANTQALKDAKAKIDVAQKSLKEAREEIGTILKLVKGNSATNS